MTNRQIREAIEVTAANCIHNLTILAGRLSDLDDVAEEDVQIVQDAARDVARVLTNLMDDFADELPADLGDFPPALVAALHAKGWTKNPG